MSTIDVFFSFFEDFGPNRPSDFDLSLVHVDEYLKTWESLLEKHNLKMLTQISTGTCTVNMNENPDDLGFLIDDFKHFIVVLFPGDEKHFETNHNLAKSWIEDEKFRKENVAVAQLPFRPWLVHAYLLHFSKYKNWEVNIGY